MCCCTTSSNNEQDGSQGEANCLINIISGFHADSTSDTLLLPSLPVRCDIETLNNRAQNSVYRATMQKGSRKKFSDNRGNSFFSIFRTSSGRVSVCECERVVYLFKSFLLNFSTSSQEPSWKRMS